MKFNVQYSYQKHQKKRPTINKDTKTANHKPRKNESNRIILPPES